MPEDAGDPQPVRTATGGQSGPSDSLEAAALRSAIDPIFILSHDGTIRTWNGAAAARFGYAPEEAIGASIGIIVPEAYRREVFAILARVVREGTPERYDAVRRHKAGHIVPISFAMSPISGEDGTIVGALVVGHDLTSGSQSGSTFRVAFEASPCGLMVVDRFGVILMANSEIERLFGYTREELVGQQVERLLPPDRRDDHRTRLQQYGEAPTRRAMGMGRDLQGCRKDGSLFPVEVGLNPSESAGGRFVVTTVIDVTERRRQEMAVHHQADELRRSNIDLEQFAYIASHDLQEPLRMVASYTQLLSERYKDRLDDRANKYLAYAFDGARRMQSLVRDLLAYSRVSSSDRPSHQRVDSAEVARRVIAGMARQIEEAGIAVTLGPLPIVVSNDTELQSIFHNLISNAVKFRGDDHPTIQVSAEEVEGFWQFLIQDNGIGIDERYHQRVFQMFQRLYERGKYEGNGIGLAIAKKIVEQHGGKIWVESAPGKGSSFYFTIPINGEAAR
jgi:PAS domain S-box-containing protein